MCVSENGFNYLEKLSNNMSYNFDGYQIKADKAMRRLEFLCEFFKSYLEKTGGSFFVCHINFIILITWHF